MHQRALEAHAEDVVGFLQGLRRRLRGGFAVVWDRHGIHNKSRAVKAFLAQHPEIVAEDLPPYAPSVNPDEWVWSWTKYGKLSNLAALDSDHLRRSVCGALDHLSLRPDLLNAFIHDAELLQAG